MRSLRADRQGDGAEAVQFGQSATRSELRRLLTFDTYRAVAGQIWLEVKADCRVAADKEYPYALVVGDDPHHRAYLTEKSDSLAEFLRRGLCRDVGRNWPRQLELDDGDSVRIESDNGKVVVPVKISQWMEGDVVFVPRNFAATQINAL